MKIYFGNNPASKRKLFYEAWEKGVELHLRKMLKAYIDFHKKGVGTLFL